MKNKQLITFGIIALGLYFLTKKKDDDQTNSDNAQDNVLPANDQPAEKSTATPVVASGSAVNVGDFQTAN